MYNYFINGLNIILRYNYDHASLIFLKDDKHKIVFEQKINLQIRKFFKENNDLITSNSISVSVDVNEKNSFFHVKERTDNLIVIGINLIRLKSHDGFDIVEYIDNKIPVSRWFVFRRWYGNSSTFFDLILHEIRHCVDIKADILEKYVQRKQSEGAPEILLLHFINQIRSEAYPKLFDSRGEVRFDKDELALVKENLFLAVRKESLTETFKDKYKLLSGGKVYEYNEEMFFHVLSPGNHHYYLARFMAFIIAYSLMDKETVLNPKRGLKVKDMSFIIESGVKIKQPSNEKKDEAGAIILRSNAFRFVYEFDQACTKLSISNNAKPFSISIYKKLRKELIENFKIINDQSYKDLVNKWRSKQITFAELKRIVKTGK